MRLLAVCILAAVAGCLTVPPALAATEVAGPAATPAAVAQQTMEIVDFKFANPTVRLNVGDAMTWTNDDRAPHDVSGTKAPTRFQSPLLMKGESWKYTFKVAGRYDYICSVHPDMKAVVDVAAAAKSDATGTTAVTKRVAVKAIGAKSAAKPTANKPVTRKFADTLAAVGTTKDAPSAVEAAGVAIETDATAADETGARAAEAENVALTANARQLKSVREWGGALVGVALVSLLIVGMHGGSARANAPKPEWAGGVGVSPSRHVRRPRRS